MTDSIKINNSAALKFVSADKISSLLTNATAAAEKLEKGTGLGNDFLGWLHLPSSITSEFISDVQHTANLLREKCEYRKRGTTCEN